MKTPQPFYEELAWPTPAGRAFLYGLTSASGMDAGRTYVSTGAHTPVRWNCSPDLSEQVPWFAQGTCCITASHRNLKGTRYGNQKAFQRANIGSRRLKGIEALEQPEDPGSSEVRGCLRAYPAAEHEDKGPLTSPTKLTLSPRHAGSISARGLCIRRARGAENGVEEAHTFSTAARDRTESCRSECLSNRLWQSQTLRAPCRSAPSSRM